MGRLINPGIGELSDRLSILALKILHGPDKGVDVSHFTKERAAILTQLRTRDLTGKWFDGYSDLAAVNAALWGNEDHLRHLRNLPIEKRAQWAGFDKTWPEQLAEVAIKIQELNDKRATLIRTINEEAGDPAGEKV